MTEAEFWAKIEQQYYEYENILSDLRFPREEDIERFQLSIKTDGAVESNYDAYYYGQSDRALWDILGPMKMLGIPLPESCKDLLMLKEVTNIKEMVFEGIKNKELSLRFLVLWGEYNAACSTVISFISSDGVDRHEEKNIRKNMPNLVERYIFAFWMKEHWLIQGKSKEDARDELAELIPIIMLNPEFPEWKKDALENMLAKDKSGIKKTYTELSGQEIERIVTTHSHYKHLFEIKE